MAVPAEHSKPGYVRANVQNIPDWIPWRGDDLGPIDRAWLGANENNFGSCIDEIASKKSANSDSFSSGELESSEHATPSSDPSGSFNFDVEDEASFVDVDCTSTADLAHLRQQSFPLNRYPAPIKTKLRQDIAQWRSLPNEDFVRLGLGALELVDSIIRATCEPKADAMLITPPTFFGYAERAVVNDIAVVEVPLELHDDDFVMQTKKVQEAIAGNPCIKLVMLASPGNPTGSLIPTQDIEELLKSANSNTVVVVDEAYIDLALDPVASTVVPLVLRYPNLVVLNTFSKAQGLAGLRLGAAYAQPYLLKQIAKVQLPHLISTNTSFIGRVALTPDGQAATKKLVTQTIEAREHLIESLSSSNLKKLGIGSILGGNQANFVVVPILKGSVPFSDANARARHVVSTLSDEYRIQIKFMGTLAGVEGCIRITVGTKMQQEQFIASLIAIMRQS